ncbi:MAG: amidohydrolase [Firmicutes bacterium]|nr:amidohydrolase [Bacillota bacterium]MCL5040692.1 amidohydrolase [Bacillota bacterium]
MSKLLIRGGTIVTMTGPARAPLTTDLAVEDGLIKALFPVGDALPRWQPDETIDATGLLVLPGFSNTHSHAAMTILRGMADDFPLKEWLEAKIWPAETRLSREDVYWGALLGLAEMIRSGITSLADMYFYAEEVARAVEEAGVRALLARGLFSRAWEASLNEGLDLHQRWQGRGNGRISVALAPHAPYTCSPPHLKEVRQLAGQLGVPIHIHLAETRREVEESRKNHGLTPVEFLERLGLFEVPVLAAHCVHLSPSDVELIARRQVQVSHNPVSNAKLGSGIAPLPALLHSGARVALGTDGAASSNRLDMFGTMRQAGFLQKAANEDPTFPDAYQLLRLATQGGSQLFPGSGQITPGANADLILIDPDRPHLTPSWDVYSSLVYSTQPQDVRTVIIGGRTVMKDWELLTIDEAAVIREVRKRAAGLASHEVQAPLRDR